VRYAATICPLSPTAANRSLIHEGRKIRTDSALGKLKHLSSHLQ